MKSLLFRKNTRATHTCTHYNVSHINRLIICKHSLLCVYFLLLIARTEAKLKLKEDGHFDTLSTSPNAISTPQPTPKKSSAPIIPNNALVPTLAELSMTASISDPVIIANIDTVKELMSRCDNMIPQSEGEPEIFEPTGRVCGAVIVAAGSNGESEKTPINNELNLFTRYYYYLLHVYVTCIITLLCIIIHVHVHVLNIIIIYC